jgi:multicomponent K+:H+ antiporter subunit A
MTLPLILFLPLLAAPLPALFDRPSHTGSAWTAGGVTGIALALLLTLVPEVLAGQTPSFIIPWLAAVGINFSLRLDGLGLLFGLMILGIGLLVILYARYYLTVRDPMSRFYTFFLLFMGSMLGIVLAENLILLLMFWELTSMSSFLLIGYWNHRSDARQGARLALTITGGGGLALLAGALILGHMAGSFELSVILKAGPQIKQHSLYPWALVLILLGAFSKSAQFPFHFWLPHAMAAPTPVSAYLHSATMVKAGLFLLARLTPALAGTDLWFYLVSTTGLATFLFGSYQALFQHDLKGLLAYSTISHLGLITLLFGLGTPLSEVAGIFHLINHATFKASLFMAAGIIDHETGTRDMRRINGLFRFMPQTAVLAIVAAAAMAGVPLLNGFLSKEMFFAETVHYTLLGRSYWVIPIIATVAGIFSVAYSMRFVHDVFFNGEPIDLPRTPHEPPVWMKIPVAVLVVVCLLVGILPQRTVAFLLTAAVNSVLLNQPPPTYDLAVWHGFTLPLFMSLIAFTGGILLYFRRQPLFRLHEHYEFSDGKGLFDRLLNATLEAARRITAALENGSLQRYLVLLLSSALLVTAPAFGPPAQLNGPLAPSTIDGVSLLVALSLAVATIGTVLLQRQRLKALVVLSVVGLGVALAFVRFSAPDLALTQLGVELVTTVLFLLALYRLPQQVPAESSPGRRLRDAVLAALAGVGAAALTWSVLTRPQQTIADYFLANSMPGGGGANVVNVILVDFRGFDTLGEITVLTIAALGVYAMLAGLHLPTPSARHRGEPGTGGRHPLILSVTSRLVFPLTLLVATYLFLRGHNLPGGGFIAGLLTALALVLRLLADGRPATETRHGLHYPTVIALGLLLAVLTGLSSWLLGYPFLSSAFTHLHWPVVGDFELASALVFDLGVYLTVVGVVMLILTAISLPGTWRLTSESNGPSTRENR